jgi:hypothetical protein
MFIRTVAAEVRGHDAKYEASLKERERNNPKFGFLTNKHVRAFLFGLVYLVANISSWVSIEDMRSIGDLWNGRTASIQLLTMR